MNRNDLKKLAMTRLREAKVLLLNGEYSGAYYLAGYVIECGLKACIAKQTKKFDFPDRKTVNDSYTHDLAALVKVAGLKASLDLEIQNEPNFSPYWSVVQQWTEQHRYRIIDQKTAEDRIEAIFEAKHGVLKWLRHHW